MLKNKNQFLLILLVVMLLSIIPVSAHAETPNDININELELQIEQLKQSEAPSTGLGLDLDLDFENFKLEKGDSINEIKHLNYHDRVSIRKEYARKYWLIFIFAMTCAVGAVSKSLFRYGVKDTLFPFIVMIIIVIALFFVCNHSINLMFPI